MGQTPAGPPARSADDRPAQLRIGPAAELPAATGPRRSYTSPQNELEDRLNRLAGVPSQPAEPPGQLAPCRRGQPAGQAARRSVC